MHFLRIVFLCLLIISLNLDGILGTHQIHQMLCIIFTLFVLVTRSWKLLHCALLVSLMGISGILLPLLRLNYIILPFLLPFLLATIIILPFKQTRAALSWIKIGTLDRIAMLLVGVTGILSTAALLLWAYWSGNLEHVKQFAQSLSHYPQWLIYIFGVPLFAILNAFAEEVVYRGVLQEALIHIFSNAYVVLILQASAFAAAHYAFGFPNGAVGYGMVFVWALMLGYLRVRTRGMLAPYIAHLIADLTIGYYVLTYTQW
jgi:membrane protease YdiL (CAAX protease family)